MYSELIKIWDLDAHYFKNFRLKQQIVSFTNFKEVANSVQKQTTFQANISRSNQP